MQNQSNSVITFDTQLKTALYLNRCSLFLRLQNDVNRKPLGQIPLDGTCRIARTDGALTFEVSAIIKAKNPEIYRDIHKKKKTVYFISQSLEEQ